MIEYLKKDITTVTEGVIAHGVNCRGAMGSGVAGALRRKYPQIFPRYSNICKMYDVNPDWMLGMVDLVEVSSEPEPILLVANCFTQVYYGRDGKRYADAEAVRRSINTAVQAAYGLAIPFYMPKIGCGLGGLDWDGEIEPIVEEIANKYNTTIYVCDL